MPSLNDILQDMLVVMANGGKLEGLRDLDPGSFAPPKPSPLMAGPMNQPIWYWEKQPRGSNPSDPGYLGQVTHLNCWARAMAETHNDDNLGWMTVCHTITWSPVKVDVKVGGSSYRLTLPLTEKHVVKTFYLAGGHNPGKGWWPLEADVDPSFFQVFVYDITGKRSSDEPEPVPKEVYEHDDFMPDPGSGPLPAPTLSPGEQVDLTAAHKHYVCVVMSLVCCTERADFEPGALVGVARPVPHFMIMTNLPVSSIQASIRIERPDESGYYGTSHEPGRPPMHHPDMDPPLKAIAVTDTNVFRAIDIAGQFNIPFWDLIFDYVLAVPDSNFIKLNDELKVVKDEPSQRTLNGALGLLDYERVKKAARGAAEGVLAAVLVPGVGVSLILIPLAAAAGGAEGGSLVFTRPGLRIVHRGPNSKLASGFAQKVYGASGLRKDDLLPRKKADVVKWARQGEFDSIHIAPRMKAHLLLGKPELSVPAYGDTLSEIRMAPFCEHDCMHTHWRWGASWNHERMQRLLKNNTPISGFGSTDSDAKFSGVGVPYTEIGAPLVPRNQEVKVSFESGHVFNYTATIAKDIAPGVWQAVYHHGSGYAVSIVEKMQVNSLIHLLTGDIFDSVPEPQFSEFYWTLRFQDTVDGPLERIEIADVDRSRLMGL